MESLWAMAGDDTRVLRLEQSEKVDALIRFFERVAEEEGWRPEGALRLGTDRSVYFALEAQGRIIGGLQLARPDSEGRLPCQDVWPEVVPPSRSAHVTVLALDRAYRGGGSLFWLLGAELQCFCFREGISALLLEATPRVLPLYRRLGWPLQARGEKRLHWGEECLLCSLGVPEVAETVLWRAERSPFYRRVAAQAFRISLPDEGEEGLLAAVEQAPSPL